MAEGEGSSSVFVSWTVWGLSRERWRWCWRERDDGRRERERDRGPDGDEEVEEVRVENGCRARSTAAVGGGDFEFLGLCCVSSR